MLRVPLQAVANQTLAVTLARQNAQITLRQFDGNLYFSLTANGVSIVRTRVCRDRSRILLDARYQPFVGDFAFVDTQGTDDPTFEGLDSRFRLYYLSATE